MIGINIDEKLVLKGRLAGAPGETRTPDPLLRRH